MTKSLVGPAVAGLAAIAVLTVGSTTALSAGTTTVPAVLTCAGKTEVRPTSYVLACADANTYFNAVHWTSWTSSSARATATFVQNNCAPTCAAGKFLSYPATLTLSQPKSTKMGVLFSMISYSYRVSASTTLPLTTLAGTAPAQGRPRCSADPRVAARYVIPPPPFKVSVVTVDRATMPSSEPKGRGPDFKRLYRVAFNVLRGNPVLEAGHRYTQFAYVSRTSTNAQWCFLKGGSGP